MNKLSEIVTLVGPHGVCKVDVTLSFDIDPKQFSPGMAMIATKELQDAVQRIVDQARRTK